MIHTLIYTETDNSMGCTTGAQAFRLRAHIHVASLTSTTQYAEGRHISSRRLIRSRIIVPAKEIYPEWIVAKMMKVAMLE